MKEKLFGILDNCETKQLAKVFEDYMISKGIKKRDGRRKNNLNTYSIHGKCTNWNRVECYYHKNSEEFSKENLSITLRKRAGYYLIISKNGKRAFERSYNDVVYYDEALLKEIMDEHMNLLNMLFEI